MKKTDVRIKLIILIFITLIPLSLLKISTLRTGLRSSMETELRASQDFAEAIHLSFMNFLDKTWTSQYAIGTAIISNPDWSKKDIQNYLNTVLPKDKAIIEYSWVTPQGIVISSTNSYLIGKSFSSREYFQEIIAGKEQVISSLRLSMDNNMPIIPIARGLRVNNELKGILVSVIDANNLRYIFPEKRLGETSTFGLIDNYARIVYLNNNPYIDFEERLIKEDSPARKALKGETVKTYAPHFGFDETERIGIDCPITEIGWSCFVTTSVSDLLSQELGNFKKDLLIFLAVYIISFITAILAGNRLTNSINKLKRAAQEVMTGNLDTRVNLVPDDNLADVGQAFDRMTEGLTRKLQEVEEYNSLKSQFLSTISHELKTPLNIILGCVQLMEKLDTSNTASFSNSLIKYIKMQKQNSYRLLRLINNLIDVNKAEVNHIKINLSNGNIVQVVEDITLSVVEYTNLKNINVIFDTQVEEKITAFDADMLERIMLNLLSNAIKFTDQGGIIEVNIYDGEEKILISVMDNGIGIPENKLQMIFERFTQVDNTLRRKSEGSGIGLSLVKSLVEMHDGSISVRSELGKGSEFIIELPVKLVDGGNTALSSQNITNVERVHIEFADIYM